MRFRHRGLRRVGLSVATISAVLLSFLVAADNSADAAPALPPGFITVSIPSGQTQLTDFQFLPDSTGKLTASRLTIGKASGDVVYLDATNAARTLAHIPVFSQGDMGLISFALSNKYSADGTVFLLYTYVGPGGKPTSRLERWIATNPLAPTALRPDKVLLDGITQLDAVSANNSHGPGTVAVAPDDSLFVGFGDAASFGYADHLARRALDPDDPHGKILHIDANGNGVTGNPYLAKAPADSWRGRMFASGFRNPFRFSIDPQSGGTLYVGDVGWTSYEEIDVVRAGFVGGWPCWEAGHHTPGYDVFKECLDYYTSTQLDNPDGTRKETIPAPAMPLYEFPHFYNGAGHSAAAVGGVFYNGTSYPAAYRKSYFFGDYPPNSPSRIFTLATDGTTIQRAPEPKGFASAIGGPVSFKIGPGGDVYFADITTSTINRIEYAPGNHAPEVTVTTVNADPIARNVCFDATGSYDPDGDTFTVSADFGDGTSATGLKTCHAYGAGTTFTATISATDRLGATGTTSVTVTPGDFPPTLQLTAPPAGSKFSVGDIVRLTAVAKDHQGASLPVTVSTMMVHCPAPSDCHNHYDGAPQTLTPDAGGQVQYATIFPDHGQNTSEQLTFTVTNSAGTTAAQTYTILPNLHSLSVASPAPANIDGFAVSTIQAVAGSTNSVSVPTRYQYLTFTGWSDGGSPDHTLVMPNADTTLSANYKTAIDQRYAALGGATSFLGAPTGPEVSTGTGRTRTYTGGRLYWSPATGVHEVHGAILARYLSFGGPTGWLGFPTSDELPVTGGRESDFQRGRVYWSAATGAHEVHGLILQRYLALRGPSGYGLPVNDESTTPDRIGRYNHFTAGRSIYWTPATGAHAVYGAIRSKWAALGWERSRLGYPTTDEFGILGGRESDFQHGRIWWNRATRITTVKYT